MSIINILDLNLYLISFVDTESIINLSELNKESYQVITKLNLYKQIISHRKKKPWLRYFNMIVYSIDNNYIELFKCLFFNDKKELDVDVAFYAVVNSNIKILEILHEHKYDIAKNLSDITNKIHFGTPNIIIVLQWLVDHKYLKEINSEIIIRQGHLHILIFMKKNNLKILPYTKYDLNNTKNVDNIDILLWLIANYFIESEIINLIQGFVSHRNNVFKKNYSSILKCAVENNLISFEIFMNEIIERYP